MKKQRIERIDTEEQRTTQKRRGQSTIQLAHIKVNKDTKRRYKDMTEVTNKKNPTTQRRQKQRRNKTNLERLLTPRGGED